MKHLAFVIAVALAGCGGKKDEPKAEAEPKTTKEKVKEATDTVVDKAKEAADVASDKAKATKEVLAERVQRLEGQLGQLDKEIAEHTAAIATASDAAARKAAQEGLDKVREAKAATQKKLDEARAEAAK